MDAPQVSARDRACWRIFFAGRVALCVLVVGEACGSTALAKWQTGSDGDREYLIKAAFLYNFGKYVQWPAESLVSKSPFLIGILGPDRFGAVMEQLGATKTIEGRPIAVRRFASMNEYEPCHILFMASDAETAEKAAAIRQLQGKPVLLVGEESGLAEQGAVINFFTEANRVRFEINVEAAKRGQLRISSKLLNLGKLVGQ